MISNQEYDELMAFMESRILDLWTHENKVNESKGKEPVTYTQTGFPITNIFKCGNADKCYYLIFNNAFLNLVNGQLETATKWYPTLFGTGNPHDVIHALYKTSGFCPTLDESVYEEFLANKTCYVIYKRNAQLCDDILRIDLFRFIDVGRDGREDFIGGLLHALKHYSINGINLSINQDQNDISNVPQVIELIAEAFESREKDEEKENDYIAFRQLDGTHRLKFVFYYEQESGVFFISTSRKERI
jgi:hypothetical protein